MRVTISLSSLLQVYYGSSYEFPTDMGLSANPRGDRDRCLVISRRTLLISGCCSDGCLIFSNSCFIFMTWLWIGTPLYSSSSLITALLLLLLLLLIFFCSIFSTSKAKLKPDWKIANPSHQRPCIPVLWIVLRVYIYGGNNEKDTISSWIVRKRKLVGKVRVNFSTCTYLEEF